MSSRRHVAKEVFDLQECLIFVWPARLRYLSNSMFKHIDTAGISTISWSL